MLMGLAAIPRTGVNNVSGALSKSNEIHRLDVYFQKCGSV